MSGNNLKVVKSNSLINASYQMDLSEHRLMLVAIVKTRGTNNGFTKENPVEITAKEYAEFFQLSPSTVYEMMKAAQHKLKKRTFDYSEQYKGKYIEHISEPIFSRSSYIDQLATIRLSFSESIRPLISELEGKFTEYELMQIKELTSQYAIRLYELLIQWRSVGKVPEIPLEDFRLKLGIEKDEYQRFFDLDKRVIDVAIKQISTSTDIKNIKMEKHKDGRVIRGLSFTFKAPFKKEKTIQATEGDQGDKQFVKLTPKQVIMFSLKIAKAATDNIEGFEGLAKMAEQGWNTQDLAVRIQKDLHNQNIKPYEKYLVLAGLQIYKKTDSKKSADTNENSSVVPPNESNALLHIPENVMKSYTDIGGTISKDKFIEIAMNDNVPAVMLVHQEISKILLAKNG